MQVLAGLHLQDMDVDEDEDVRPQADQCIRKEYRRLTAAEVRGFQAAINSMKNNGVMRILIQHHRPSDSPGAHFGPAFAWWHRCFLIRYADNNNHCNNNNYYYYNLSHCQREHIIRSLASVCLSVIAPVVAICESNLT